MNFKEYFYPIDLFESLTLVNPRLKKADSTLIDPKTGKAYRRRNKIEQVKKIIEKEIEKGTPRENLWANFSCVHRFGIYYGARDGGTPLGLYGYPIDYLIEKEIFRVPYGSERTYLHIFKTKENSNIVSMKKGRKDVDIKDDEINKIKADFNYEIGRFVKKKLQNLYAILSKRTPQDLMSVFNSFYGAIHNFYYNNEDAFNVNHYQSKSDFYKRLQEKINRTIEFISELRMSNSGGSYSDYYTRMGTGAYSDVFYFDSNDFDAILKNAQSLKFMRKIGNKILKFVDNFEKERIKILKKIDFPYKKQLEKFCEENNIDFQEVFMKTLLADQYSSQNVQLDVSGDLLYKLTRKISEKITQNIRKKSDIYDKSYVRWTNLLRKLGIGGFADHGLGRIYSSEPAQGVFFDPKQVKLVSTIQINNANNDCHDPYKPENEQKSRNTDWDIKHSPIERWFSGVAETLRSNTNVLYYSGSMDTEFVKKILDKIIKILAATSREIPKIEIENFDRNLLKKIAGAVDVLQTKLDELTSYAGDRPADYNDKLELVSKLIGKNAKILGELGFYPSPHKWSPVNAMLLKTLETDTNLRKQINKNKKRLVRFDSMRIEKALKKINFRIRSLAYNEKNLPHARSIFGNFVSIVEKINKQDILFKYHPDPMWTKERTKIFRSLIETKSTIVYWISTTTDYMAISPANREKVNQMKEYLDRILVGNKFIKDSPLDFDAPIVPF